MNTKTNTVVGAELHGRDVYASTSTPIPADETSFSVTIPRGTEGCKEVGGVCAAVVLECATAGQSDV